MVNSSPTPNALAFWMDKNGWQGEDYIILGVTSWAVSLPTYKETPFEQVCTCKKHHQKAEEDRSGEFGTWQLASKLSNSVDLGSAGKCFQSSRSVWQSLEALGAGLPVSLEKDVQTVLLNSVVIWLNQI